MNKNSNVARQPNRREMLQRVGAGFGSLALSALLAEEAHGADSADPLAVRKPHFQARAKRVIFLFMPGGPSQVDTFDPKPELTKFNGKSSPKLYLGQKRNLLASPWKFRKHGQSGLEVSELFPCVAKQVDRLCILRGMVADDVNHPGGCLQMNTGERVATRPSLGSWVTYGLGTENQNLPGFIAIGPGPLIEGNRQYGAAFLPAAHQGTFVSDMKNPIRNLKNNQVSPERQRLELDALRRLNEFHRIDRSEDSRLAARIESFELAYRMQTQAPDAFDLTKETDKVQSLYGVDRKETETFGRQCLLARRLVERGVRFVQLYHTSGGFQPWDQHSDLKGGHEKNALATDRPIAGLLEDLQARGLLEDTLVIWGGEFGRTPAAEGKDGRDHHPYGFTMWLAGGGVRGGLAHGETDEFGWDAVQDRVHIHDLHATILHLLGLDHEKLTYRHAGRDYRLTDVSGVVAKAILA
ncbi:DUF1501 domain-containing protein [Telmatocola sphagniphila]|uniref:DUF1501 domain-containing protein n=1 Tax=Telmatocola sphagniphila TaxID=1123043 RepID=A0A8E6B454_9BACT|nr:DUF1501 domain-containing protein [Telmatocola sphagniphila]QVL31603.1 DUF1501 domain-containing protein [Telmatocola sphagniphila]